MALKDDKIKDLFSSKLKDFEVDVPASVWGGLGAGLSNLGTSGGSAGGATSSVGGSGASSTTSTIVAAVGKAKLIALSIVAGVAATVATVIVITDSEGDVADKIELAVALDSTTVDKKNELVVPSDHESLLAEENSTKEESFSRTKSVSTFSAISKSVNKIDSTSENFVLETDSLENIDEDIIEEKTERELPESLLPEEEITELEEIVVKKKRKGLSVGILGSMGALSAGESKMAGNDLLFSDYRFNRELFTFAGGEGTEVHLDHDQPLSVGLLFGISLSERFSIETGLVYTRLSSKITSKGVVNIRENIKFDYLGVPINLNYTLYRFGRLNLYGTLGAMIETDVNGYYTSKVGVPNYWGFKTLEKDKNVNMVSDSQEQRKNVKQAHVQLSAHALLGVSYPIYRKLYIYGTVGGAYYFDANNKYQTIYSDKQLQLDLNVGLKLNF